MSDRGRHLRQSGFGFYRDLLLLAAGILVVGAVVFGALSLWASNGNDPSDPTVPARLDADATTTSTSIASSTSPTAPTTTAPPDTTAPPSTAPTTTPTTIREARDPSEVRVVVLNSTGVTGLAAQLTEELAPLGYQLGEPSNYTPELSDTMIFHSDDFGFEAVQLLDVVPDATVAADSDLAAEWGVDVVVVLGRSYLE